MFTLKNKQGTGRPDNVITTKRKIDNRNNQKNPNNRVIRNRFEYFQGSKR